MRPGKEHQEIADKAEAAERLLQTSRRKTRYIVAKILFLSIWTIFMITGCFFMERFPGLIFCIPFGMITAFAAIRAYRIHYRDTLSIIADCEKALSRKTMLENLKKLRKS